MEDLICLAVIKEAEKHAEIATRFSKDSETKITMYAIMTGILAAFDAINYHHEVRYNGQSLVSFEETRGTLIKIIQGAMNND